MEYPCSATEVVKHRQDSRASGKESAMIISSSADSKWWHLISGYLVWIPWVFNRRGAFKCWRANLAHWVLGGSS